MKREPEGQLCYTTPDYRLVYTYEEYLASLPPDPVALPWCEPDIPPGFFRHSILDEESTVRAHVCADNHTVYVFETIDAIETIKRVRPFVATADQNGVSGITGQGWLVKIRDIPNIRVVLFDEYPLWASYPINSWSTSPKGKFAQDCVLALNDCYRFPFKIQITLEQSRNRQLAGIDAVVVAGQKIQVKCDYPAAKTGNLFLQHSERNPLKRT